MHISRLAILLPVLLALMLIAIVRSGIAGESPWVRPSGDAEGKPVWGFRNGIQVGLPDRFPYGILRIFYPAVVREPDKPLNFLAVEPVVDGVRGLSELEYSQLDKRAGKRMWSADEPQFSPRSTLPGARGVIRRDATSETLSVNVMMEPFDNKARAYLRLTFHSLRPGEVQLEVFSAPGSAAMEHCIVTATMGNFARLRLLHLKDRTLTSYSLWPDYKGNGFAASKEFGLDQMNCDPQEGYLVSAAPDECEPQQVRLQGKWWDFKGVPAKQYWRVEKGLAAPETLVRVNGRYTYWSSDLAIPGGIAFENFELQFPFTEGQRYYYGVNPPQ